MHGWIKRVMIDEENTYNFSSTFSQMSHSSKTKTSSSLEFPQNKFSLVLLALLAVKFSTFSSNSFRFKAQSVRFSGTCW